MEDEEDVVIVMNIVVRVEWLLVTCRPQMVDVRPGGSAHVT